jgi:hypothetical protein
LIAIGSLPLLQILELQREINRFEGIFIILHFSKLVNACDSFFAILEELSDVYRKTYANITRKEDQRL